MADIKVGTRKKFGPYKGSAQNGGREIYVWKVKTATGWRTETKNKAREDYEKSSGRKLPKSVDVYHKNNKHYQEVLLYFYLYITFCVHHNSTCDDY